LRTAASPARVIIMDKTVANMGLSIKKRDIIIASRLLL
jgi:hypothetical protein